MTFSLNWLPEAVYFYLLIFARIGTMVMLMPAVGEGMIPARLRLGFALAFSFIVFPIISTTLPGLDTTNLYGAGILLFHELAVGFIFGSIGRLITTSAQAAGSIIAYQAGLSIAQSADPTQNGVQGAQVGSFLAFLGVTLIFATDLHHVILSALFESYKVLPATSPLMFGDAAKMVVDTVAGAFGVGVQMAAPFIVFGLVFNLGLGLLARLMPQVQVFFMAMPANIGVGMLLFALLLVMTMGLYLTHVESELAMLRG